MVEGKILSDQEPKQEQPSLEEVKMQRVRFLKSQAGTVPLIANRSKNAEESQLNAAEFAQTAVEAAEAEAEAREDPVLPANHEPLEEEDGLDEDLLEGY